VAGGFACRAYLDQLARSGLRARRSSVRNSLVLAEGQGAARRETLSGRRTLTAEAARCRSGEVRMVAAAVRNWRTRSRDPG
jgi:hypothetical protein